MRKLDLDFVKLRPIWPWTRWVLFAIAAAFAVDLTVTFITVSTRIAKNEALLDENKRSAQRASRQAPARAPSPEEMRIAEETIQRLSMPWDKLFRSLESSASDGITLLSIDPEPKNGTVLIQGEAANYRAALDYVALLANAGALQRPHLVRHERRQDDTGDTVLFSILASWSKPK